MMVEKSEVKPESLLNLEDLLQCPVCYEIPLGQIFQCNEGHHVCGGCKMRLDVCPVCRALFFGTRNYAMEELISNFRKMRSLKLGSKASGSGSSQGSTPAKETTSAECEDSNDENNVEENNTPTALEPPSRPAQPCSGLFRCLCCKPGSTARLPSARLLNHIRYFHSPSLLESRSENGEYLQAWQFESAPGKLVTAVRISDMGIFFLTIDIKPASVCAWLSMAATPWIAHEYNYTVSICGNDREAIFSDSVWSVRSCEGALKKRGHCLLVKDEDALALTSPSTISGKLSVRRTPSHQLAVQTTPRAVLRIANRVNNQVDSYEEVDYRRVSHAPATIRREGNVSVQSEAQILARADNNEHVPETSSRDNRASDLDAQSPAGPTNPPATRQELSRNARKRLKQRMRAVLDSPIPPEAPTTTSRGPASSVSQPRQNGPITQSRQNTPATQPRQNTPATQLRQNASVTQARQNTSATHLRQNAPVTEVRQNNPGTQSRHNNPVTQSRQNNHGTQPRQNTNVAQVRQNTPVSQPRQNGVDILLSGFNIVTEEQPAVPSQTVPSSSSTSQSVPAMQRGNGNRNKQKRRHRR